MAQVSFIAFIFWYRQQAIIEFANIATFDSS